MVPWLLAAAAALVSVLAFPPFGPGWLVVIGVSLFLGALRMAGDRYQGILLGALYGLGFFGGLMWWMGLLDPLALILIPVQAVFFALYGWWLAGTNRLGAVPWLVTAVGGWAVMELLRYRIPVGGQEWGAVGYALSDSPHTRLPVPLVGTSGLTVLVVVVSAVLALAIARRWEARAGWALVAPLVVFAASLPTVVTDVDGDLFPVAIVQGSTPCPFEKCPPDERLRTFQQHLHLTETIDPGSVRLVVWPESSTGSVNADPVLNPDIRRAIGDQARRMGVPILVGGDRTVSDADFINANVLFDEDGEIVGEYRKQHPVPFGEYIPWRPVFEWIPALRRVPRDMVRGDGPVVFDLGDVHLGSVISWEGGFSRYALQHRREGANLLVVATNKSSYGPDAPTSDQFIGMTRMRAAELGVPVVHAAVTGKSAIIDHRGDLVTTSDTGSSVVLFGEVGVSTSTLYSTTGDLVMYLAAGLAVLTWWRTRSLVGSDADSFEEE